MRYPASEKLEIIRIVEQSHIPVRRTLAQIGIPPTTFYRWYDRYVDHGPEGLEDRPSRPSKVWNRIPDPVRDKIVDLALNEPELSPRELAVRFTDTKKYFVSEASVYRLLKSYDLITSPAYVVVKAADEFRDKTTAPNQMWQGVPTKTHVLNILHRLIDGKTTGGPDIDTPQALILRREPKANVERYDGLRASNTGGRHAS